VTYSRARGSKKSGRGSLGLVAVASDFMEVYGVIVSEFEDAELHSVKVSREAFSPSGSILEQGVVTCSIEPASSFGAGFVMMRPFALLVMQ